MNFQYLDTPIGTLRLLSNGAQLVNIEFAGQYGANDAVEISDTVLTACAAQLTAYFAGKRRHFELPLAARGEAVPTNHSPQFAPDPAIAVAPGARALVLAVLSVAAAGAGE